MRKVKINDVYNRVKNALVNYPNCRDNYSLLIGSIWIDELVVRGYDREEASNIMRILFKDNKLTNVQSITRACRKVQEDFPTLRGKNRKDRIDNQEKIIKELNYVTN
tara:strand:- start:1682 stop:2002 length:321 start_codon:yes stop_codon:yes gene_type:complete